MTVNVGDVIYTKYRDFNDELQDGIFLVYSKDNYWLPNFRSFSAFKICTEPSFYQVKLDISVAPYMDHTSYINCGCTYRFREDNKYIKVKGIVNIHILEQIRKQLANLNNDYDKQLDMAICRHKMIVASSRLTLTQDDQDE